jgi:CDP-diacylglycerol---glycerol-3-phosphate 3-phosphatidyltransferase
MLSNLVTLSRVPLLGVIVILLYLSSATGQLVAAPLIVILILMDTLDGYLARTHGEESIVGSVLDIAADRGVEYVLWTVFAHLRLIPVLIPIIVLLRGTFVDAIRSMAPAHGLKPFDLMRSELGRFLVGSPWLRMPYAVVKAIAFTLLAAAYGFQTAGHPLFRIVYDAAQAISWVALGFCLLRGIPVLIEGPGVLQEQEQG